jgi:acetyl-CoA carboxylase biotin carboxyl carrier protein
MSELDLDTIRHALKTAREHGLRSIRLESGDSTFRAVLGKGRRSPAPKVSAVIELPEDPEERLAEVASHLVGYFREGEIPLRVGAVVRSGDIVGTIAALGLANDVECPIEGEVVEVCVEPGAAVEYGQVLAKVRPA